VNAPAPVPPGWWQTLRILLGAARLRAVGRRRRQRELAANRLGRSALGMGMLGIMVSLLVASVMSGAAACVVTGAAQVGQELVAERQGLIPVHGWFIAPSLAVGLGLRGQGAGAGRRASPPDVGVGVQSSCVPGAAFAAEMLAPVVANPLDWTALIVPWALYAQAYGFGYGTRVCEAPIVAASIAQRLLETGHPT